MTVHVPARFFMSISLLNNFFVHDNPDRMNYTTTLESSWLWRKWRSKYRYLLQKVSSENKVVPRQEAIVCLQQLARVRTTDGEKNRREREVLGWNAQVVAVVEKWVQTFADHLIPLAILEMFPVVSSNVV